MQLNKIVEKENPKGTAFHSLVGLPSCAFHFLQRDQVDKSASFSSTTFSAFGYQARLLALEYYKTTKVILFDQGVEYLNVSQGLLSKIVYALTTQNHKVCVWKRSRPVPNAPLEVVAQASLGIYQQIEEKLGVSIPKDQSRSYFMAWLGNVDDETNHTGDKDLTTDNDHGNANTLSLVLWSFELEIVRLFQVPVHPDMSM
eukprot:gene33537-40572_t